ncbi:MAG: protein-glutamate O-methyltransferase CheR [Candidatus Heimdallarchaeota archaeon]|nr:protein-glutamate O-methyltransferase CheR [Candidatus Heimdallarchaeota archaeon]
MSPKHSKKIAKGGTLSVGKEKEEIDKRRESKRIRRASLSNREIKKQHVKTNELFVIKQITDDENSELIIKLLSSHGIKLDFYKPAYLKRKLKGRMIRLKLKSFMEYFDYIQKNQGEIELLKKKLSINVTRFFRNRDTFDFVEQNILPRMISNNNERELTIWSSACAVGAEPYSISMLCSKFAGLNKSILGSDLSNDLLELAKNGVYDEDYFSEMEETEISLYLNEIEPGVFSIKKKIRRDVSFEQIDLTKDVFPTGLDIIFCRNVFIYLDKAAQEKIIKNFYDSLNEGGILILGKTESIDPKQHYLFKTINTHHKIYEKC